MPVSAAFSVVAEDSSFTSCGVYFWFESRAETRRTDASFRLDSAIAPDRHSAAAERLDTLSVLASHRPAGRWALLFRPGDSDRPRPCGRHGRTEVTIRIGRGSDNLAYASHLRLRQVGRLQVVTTGRYCRGRSRSPSDTLQAGIRVCLGKPDREQPGRGTREKKIVTRMRAATLSTPA